MPIRTCIGCRTEREKEELIRLVRYEDRVVVDYRAKLPGRGAYVCPKLSCIKLSMRKRRLERALKSEGPLQYQDLPERIAEAIRSRILSLLGIAAKAGALVSGWNGVKAKWGRLKLVLIAGDASQGALRRFARSDRAYVGLTKEELGRAIGKSPRSVIGITDGRLAEQLERELRRYKDVHPGD
jgi:hypothetical protein